MTNLYQALNIYISYHRIWWKNHAFLLFTLALLDSSSNQWRVRGTLETIILAFIHHNFWKSEGLRKCKILLSGGSFGFYVLCNVSETIPRSWQSNLFPKFSPFIWQNHIPNGSSRWYLRFLNFHTDNIPTVLRKTRCKNCPIWDLIQQLSSLVPITALHRKLLLSSTQSIPFTKFSLALSSDVENNGIEFFLKFIHT